VLHISAATRAGLGFIADRILDWAGPPREILVLSSKDYDPVPAANNWWGRMRAASRFVDRLQEKFPGIKLKPFLYDIDLDGKKIAHDLETADIYCKGYRYGKSAILLGRTDRDLKDFFSSSTGIPTQDLRNVEGQSHEYNTLVAGHECGHLGEDRIDLTTFGWHFRKKETKNKARLCNEISADKAAFRNYFNELARGTVTSPDAPAIFRDMRAIAAFKPGEKENIHATGPALLLPGEIDDVGNADLKLAGRMRKALAEVKNLIQCATSFNAAGAEFREGIKIDRLPAYYSFLYSQFDGMLKRGAFDYDPLEKKYVTQFMGAIERRAPSLAVTAPAPAP
jgi:hypothetical protein